MYLLFSDPTTSVPSPSTTEPRETTTAEPAKLPGMDDTLYTGSAAIENLFNLL